MKGKILGIETSCDDTAAAVVAGGKTILSNVISSQVDIHTRFGGVVPEVASRSHLEVINAIIDEALLRAELDFSQLSGIAVSYGPGLVGSLLVGVSTAKALAFVRRLPLAAVNHLEGHIYANFLTGATIGFPFLCLVVSGGHTMLIWVTGHSQMEILGRTRDDAAGEVFDKVARALNLGYPGGPVIDRLSAKGNPASINFPRALLKGEENYDFSFSGLKTAVLNYIHERKAQQIELNLFDLAASFQAAVVDVLVQKTYMAALAKGARQVLLAGGVAANAELRRRMREVFVPKAIELIYPPPELCTDNAAMIASAGYYHLRAGKIAGWDLNAAPSPEL
ncbi:MAG: tRNA (adenosine(37)-N6)-threonylcarbamoyltransferase complex transferase subunit TsaD [Firmicutes bacterium]|nr:tRNA (adenosine(37)-N6)-threonylcarbamoyltransferase complex transferase subunit TsaD [Bacillota bacterium]